MSKHKPEQTLLIVEDDTGLSSQLRWHFDQYNVVLAEDRPSAIADSETKTVGQMAQRE